MSESSLPRIQPDVGYGLTPSKAIASAIAKSSALGGQEKATYQLDAVPQYLGAERAYLNEYDWEALARQEADEPNVSVTKNPPIDGQEYTQVRIEIRGIKVQCEKHDGTLSTVEYKTEIKVPEDVLTGIIVPFKSLYWRAERSDGGP